MDNDTPSFPSCAETKRQFIIGWVLYGPLCLLSTGIVFVMGTFYDWENESLYERMWAIVVCIVLFLGIWIILPLFLALELLKFLVFPVGLLAYVLTKEYYKAYPPPSPTSRGSSSFSVHSGQVSTLRSDSPGKPFSSRNSEIPTISSENASSGDCDVLRAPHKQITRSKILTLTV